MAEDGIAIFIAVAMSLAISIAVLFGERAHRYDLIRKGKICWNIWNEV